MREDGVHASIRVLVELCERHAISLRHGLNLEAENAEPLHDRSHTSRHHSEVLTTNQHIARFDECRQLLHGLRSPEIIVSAEEEILVQTDECVLFILGKPTPGILSDDAYSRVIEVGLLGIFHEQIFVERQSVRLNLSDTHGKCRRELSQQGIRTVLGNRPNAEETENVVNPVGTEILRHSTKPLLPPEIAVSRHPFPIVRGEAPILASSREIIWWSSCHHIHIEEVRLVPSLHATRTDANRKVPLQEDSSGTGILGCFRKLQMKEVLYESIVANLFGMAVNVLRHGTPVVAGKLLPLRELGCSISVPQMAENTIRLQPLSILICENAIVGTLTDTLTLLFIEEMQVRLLQLDDLHIVESLQIIQLLPLLLERSKFLLVRKRHLPEVRINGVKSMDTDCIVGITVGRRAVLRSVADRQKLDGVHSCHSCPIRHLFEVAEVPYPLTAFRPEREQRNHKSCNLPTGSIKPDLAIRKGNNPSSASQGQLIR